MLTFRPLDLALTRSKGRILILLRAVPAYDGSVDMIRDLHEDVNKSRIAGSETAQACG
jgi:hypothetical protein